MIHKRSTVPLQVALSYRRAIDASRQLPVAAMRVQTLAWLIIAVSAKPKPLDGRIAAVTGGSRGLGRAVVDELLRQGCATVIACARNVDSLAELENVVAVAADVRRTTEGSEPSSTPSRPQAV